MTPETPLIIQKLDELIEQTINARGNGDGLALEMNEKTYHELTRTIANMHLLFAVNNVSIYGQQPKYRGLPIYISSLPPGEVICMDEEHIKNGF